MLKLNHIIFKAAFLLTLFTEISEIHSTTYNVPDGTILQKDSQLTIKGPLTKDGLGELDLNNVANSFSGGVKIKNGTVLIANKGSLGSDPNVIFTNPGGTLTTAPTASQRTIELSSIKVQNNTQTASLAPSDNTTLVTKILGATGTLMVTGEGIVSVSDALPAGALNYSVSGVLRLANATTTATGKITVKSGGTLDLATNSAGDDDIPDGPNQITIKSGGIINLPPGTLSKNITLD